MSERRRGRGPAITRRRLIGTAAVVLVGGGAAASTTGVWPFRRPLDTVGEVDFRERLRIPPLLDGTASAGGHRYDLRLESAEAALRPGPRTRMWGIDGVSPGPTIRMRTGDRVAMRVQNRLPEDSSLHWHGMHVPAAADGGPHQPIAPGAVWSPSWTVRQPAATLWYHPHPHGRTEHHVHRGLAGLLLVDDGQDRALGLPHTYGVDDVPVVVQDRTLDGDNQLDGRGSAASTGDLHDTIVVNGTVGPVLRVTARRTRLRLLNASTARSYRFAFSDDRPFALIATDGGLLERPAVLDRLSLSPGERAEIVVTMRPRDRVTLRSVPDPDGEVRDGARDHLDLLLLQAAERLRRSPPIPDRLARIAPLPDPGEGRTRRFELSNDTINGRQMEMDRIDEVVRHGTTERWTVVNHHGNPHNFHVHGTQFRVAAYDDGPPPPELRGWKDTLFLPSAASAELLLRFDVDPDETRPFMYHCHLLRHEDRGMMGQFVVVGPGSTVQAGDRLAAADGSEHHHGH